MRKLLFSVWLLLAVLSGPAHATGEVECTNGKGVVIHMLVGRLAVLQVLNATVLVGDDSWSTSKTTPEEKRIAVGQAFENDSQMLVDFMDSNLEKIVGKLRVVKLSEGGELRVGGVFSFEGQGVWEVTCVG